MTINFWEDGGRENAEWDFLKVADEAFDLLDMDGNGTIERGDIE